MKDLCALKTVSPDLIALTARSVLLSTAPSRAKPFVAIKLETMEGDNIFTEMTGNQFAMLVDCYNAANIRFATRAKNN